jgi:hypothetical protein
LNLSRTSHLQDVQRNQRKVKIQVLRLRVPKTDLPVESGGSGDLFNAGSAETDVVAALHVVVVVAALADQDVVSGLLGIVQEEQVAAVPLHQVRLIAALFPVVAAVAERGVKALTEHDEVVTGSGEGLVGVGSAVREVLAIATHDDVQAGTGVDRVIAGAALGNVVTGEVGDDVVAFTAECDVSSVTALDDVVAFRPPQKVSLSLPP